jgi:hypothetical protein
MPLESLTLPTDVTKARFDDSALLFDRLFFAEIGPQAGRI